MFIFSGGKDSTVLFHLVAEVAYRKKRRFSVLFIDWEAQYQCTIDHIQKMRMMYQDVTDTFYWVALPLTTVNGVSQFQPEWICWEPGVEWVRQPPEDAITDMAYFPFYRYAMTFEEFVPAFSSRFASNQCSVAILTGVRADESLNRFMGLVSQRKLRYADDKPRPRRHLKVFTTPCIRCMTGKPTISGYITLKPVQSTILCMI